MPGLRGFTLMELLVVIVVLGLVVGVVAPAVLPPRRAETDNDLVRLIRAARAAATVRQETVFVRLASSGEWRIEGTDTADAGDVAAGTLRAYAGPAGTIIVSPIGTCAFDVQSTAGAMAIPLEPMTCEIVEP